MSSSSCQTSFITIQLNACAQLLTTSPAGGRPSLAKVLQAGSHKLAGKPLQPVLQPSSGLGLTGLHVPGPATAELVQRELVRDLLDGSTAGDVLLVGQDEQASILQLLLAHQLHQLAVRLRQPFPV